MYHALLANRYLTTRVIPLIAVAAVGLCVALVIIVVSVMSGFLEMVRNSGRTLVGDVLVTYSVTGMPHYEELIGRLEARPEVEAATPVLGTFGLLRMPYPEGDSKDVSRVEVWGVQPEGFARVTGFGEALHWRPLPLEDWMERLEAVVDERWLAYRDSLLTELPEHADWIVATGRSPARHKLVDLVPPPGLADRLPAEPAALATALDDGPFRALVPPDVRGALAERAGGDHWTTAIDAAWAEAAAAGDLASRTSVLELEPNDTRLRLLELVPRDRWIALMPREPAELRDRLPAIARPGLWSRLVAADRRLGDMEPFLESGLSLEDHRTGRPGIVLGMHVSIGNKRRPDGSYRPLAGGYWWMPKFEVTLTTIPMDTDGIGDPKSHIFPVVNEMISGVFQIDRVRVIVPLETLQEIVRLDDREQVEVDELGDVTVVGVEPARATTILVRGSDGVTPDELKPVVQTVYGDFREHHVGRRRDDPRHVLPPPQRGEGGPGVLVQTWEESQAEFIGPVEKERQLMQTLFSIVYLVCAGLVLSIFWSIVHEKTRDIGILRSVGASRLGISWIFLRYGLFVGGLGSVVGLGIGVLVVHNINVIHDGLAAPPQWLAIVLGGVAVACLLVAIAGGRRRLLSGVLGGLGAIAASATCASVLVLRAAGGVEIWSPEVYYFTEIPNAVDYGNAVITMIGAVVFCLVGAFIPAAEAADTDPVRALRYE